MKKLLIVVAILFNSFYVQPSWAQLATNCRLQPNPQQCMDGVPTWEQTPQNSTSKEPYSGLTKGNTNFDLVGSPKQNQQPPQYPVNPVINCNPNGFGGYRCQ